MHLPPALLSKHTWCCLILMGQLCAATAQCWQPMPSGVATTLRALHFPTGQDGWVAGDAGVVLHSADSGSTWTPQSSNTTNTLNGIFFIDASTGWVVGAKGVIQKTTDGGANWVAQNSTTFTDLYDIRFADANMGCAVGACGLILFTVNGGAQWMQAGSSTTYNNYKVRLPAGGKGITATSSATLLYTATFGSGWNTVSTGVNANFRALDMLGATAYTAAFGGPILKSANAGMSWSVVGAPAGGGQWQAVSMLNANDLYVAGLNGRVFHSTNGGGAWVPDNNGIGSTDLYDLQFRDSNLGWAVGAGGAIFRYGIPNLGAMVVDSVLCAGEPIQLFATGGGAYAWSGPNGFTSSQPFTQISSATPAMAGAYTVVVTTAGCSKTIALTVKVDTLPIPKAMAVDASPCAGNALLLQAFGGTSYAWSGPQGFSSSLANPQLPNSNAAMNGSYTVTVTDGRGCTNTGAVAVSIDSLPQAVAQVTGPPPCVGASIGLAASGGSGYSWTGPQGFNSSLATPQLPNATTALNGSYLVTVTDDHGCTGTASVVLMVNTLPVVSAGVAQAVLCAGETITLQGSGGTTYAWTGPNGFSASSQNPQLPNATTAMSGAYQLTGTGANGCSNSATVNITVNPLPNASASTGPAPCPGGTIALSASGGATYCWLGPNGFNPCQQNPQITGAAAGMAGTYTVTVTGSNGCTQSATVSVSVSPAVTAVIAPPPGGLELNCIQSSVWLSASGGNLYAWSGGLGTAAAVAATSPGTFTVTVTDTSTGCQGTSSVTLIQDMTIPVISAFGGALNCKQPSLALQGTSSLPASGFHWTGPGGFVSSQQNPVVNVPGAYTLLVSGQNGCSATTGASVTGDPNPPTASATGATLTCANPSKPLSGSSPVSGVTFKWTGPGSFNMNLQNPVVSIPGVYTLQVTDASGCTGTATTTVVSDQAAPQASAAGGTLKCSASSINLVGSSGTPGVNFVWKDPGGNFLSNQATVPTGIAGTYLLTVTNPINGCTATATTTIKPQPAVDATINAPTGTELNCKYNSLKLFAGGGQVFQWLPGPGSTDSLSVSLAGTFAVIVTDTASLCRDTASVTVTSNFQPPFCDGMGGVRTCEPGFVTLQGTPAPPGGLLRWIGPGGFFSSQPNPVVNFSGIYVLSITGVNGCTAVDTAIVVDGSAFPNISGTADTIDCLHPLAKLNGSSTNIGAIFSWRGPGGYTSNQAMAFTATPGNYFLTVRDPANGCTSEKLVRVEKIDPVPPKIAAVPMFCPGTPTPLDAGLGYDTYQWNDGQNTRVITIGMAGTYTVTTTDARGCTGVSSTTVNTFVAPTARLTALESSGLLPNDQVICEEDGVSFTASGGSTYQFYVNGSVQGPPSTNNTLTLFPSGPLTVRVVTWDNHACSDTTLPGEGAGKESIDITVNPAPAPVYLQRSICPGQVVVVGGMPFDKPGEYTKILLSANGCDSVVHLTLGLNQPSLSTESKTICNGESYKGHTQTGVYTENLTTSGGCDSIVKLILVVQPGPYFPLDSDRTLCAGTASLKIPSVAAPCPGCHYHWNTGDSIPQLLLKPVKPGTYSVTVTDLNGCTTTDAMQVNLQAQFLVKYDSTLCSGDTLIWNNKVITQPGDYVVTLQASGGCDSTEIMTAHFGHGGLFLAREDAYVLPDGVTEANVPVTINDSLPPDWYLTIVQDPKKGIANALSNDEIYYARNAKSVGYDSLWYAICEQGSACSNRCDTALLRLVLQGRTIDRLKGLLPNTMSTNPESPAANQTFNPAEELCKLGYCIDTMQAKLYIFNRWGELVCCFDPYAPWDGKQGDHYLPQATYYFRLVILQEGEEEVLDGPVNLLR